MKKIYSKPSTKAVSLNVSNFMEEGNVVVSEPEGQATDEAAPAPMF